MFQWQQQQGFIRLKLNCKCWHDHIPVLDVKTWSIPARLSVQMIVLLQLITQSVRKKTWHQTSYLVSSQVCIIIKRFFFFFSLTCLCFLSQSWKTFLWTSQEVSYCSSQQTASSSVNAGLSLSSESHEETGRGAAVSQSSAAALRLSVWAPIIPSFLLRLLKQSRTVWWVFFIYSLTQRPSYCWKQTKN